MKKIINPWNNVPGYYCFGCCPNNESGVKMEFYEDGDEIISIWKPEQRFQGWIDTLHGGIQALMLDEICSWAISRKKQTAGVTVKMETRFKKSISTKDKYVILRAHITEEKRKLLIIDAGIYNTENELCTHTTCTYFTFDKKKSAEEMSFKECPVENHEYTMEEIINSL